MPTLENTPDVTVCPQCASPARQGMIRCRECGALLAGDDDFTLSNGVAATEARQCAKCGSELDPNSEECPSCASAFLDDLLGSSAESIPLQSSADAPTVAESSVRRGPAGREAGCQATPRQDLSPRTGGSAGRAKPSRPSKRRSSAPSTSPDDEFPGLFGDEESHPTKSVPAAPPPAAHLEEGEPDSRMSPACTALLASLASADAKLRIEIATALGQLGERAALEPLEAHLVDPEPGVRRAVAAALIQLGHPRGRALLDVAERKPATAVPGVRSVSSSNRGRRAGFHLDVDIFKKAGGVFAVAVLVASGGWYWMNDGGDSPGSDLKSRRAKIAAAKKAASDVTPTAPTAN